MISPTQHTWLLMMFLAEADKNDLNKRERTLILALNCLELPSALGFDSAIMLYLNLLFSFR